jgi:flagellar motor switch protein FliM
MHICIPYSTLEPIREMLHSSVRADQNQADRRWVTMLTQQLKSADVEMVAEFATARATLRQLISLKRGDFIGLDMPETVTAKVEGVSIFDCNYGVSNGRYAIKVRETLSGIEEVLKGNGNE